MRVAYLMQSAQTGARAQAEVLADRLDDVELVRGMVLDIEGPKTPYIRDRDDVIYPTTGAFEAVRAIDPDLVFVHIFNQSIVEAIAQIQTCFPTVMRVGLNFTENFYSGNLAAMSAGRVIETLQSFDHLIAPSSQTRDDLECLGIDPRRVSVVPTAIPMDEDRVREPDLNAPMTFGCLSSRITPLKNQHTLLMALGALRSRAPDLNVKLVLTGDGKQYKKALNQTAAALGVQNRVSFVDYVADPLEEFFPNIGVHCVPSHSERLSSSVLEGSRAGVATIISDSAWADEFDTLIPVQPDDPLAWAEVIEDLLTNDAYRISVARQQQEEIVSRFDVDDIAEVYRDLFATVVDDNWPFKTPSEVIHV